jgi:tetratricopeptide (TPR) repeat protein
MQPIKSHVVVLLTLSLVILPDLTRAAPEWRILYTAGEQKLKEGQVEEARRHLSLALAAAESNHAIPGELAAILDALGRSWFRAGKYFQAATSFERALKLPTQPPVRVPILCNAAQSYREAGDYRNAEKHLREALSLSPAEPDAWQLLGSVLILQRKFAEAEAAERNAFSFGGSTFAVSVWSDLAMIHEARGNHAESAKVLTAAIGLAQPGSVRARLLANLGAAELRLGHSGNSLDHLRSSLQEMEAAVGPRHPDVAAILELYSSVLRSARRKPEAQEAARRAKEIRAFLASSVDWRELR